MANRPPRDPATTEILKRLDRRRSRRRVLKIAGSGLIGAVFLGVVALAGASALRSPGGGNAPSTDGLTTISVPPVATTGTLPPPTTHTLPPRPSTTEDPSTVETILPTVSTTAPSTAAGYVIAIDPGHQQAGDPNPEPIGPGASATKARVTSGTAGTVTRVPESVVTLAVSLRLRDVLQARGVTVVMTRTTQDVNISNVERTKIANQAGADLFIRVHADGSADPNTRGIHVLYPANIAGWTDDIAATSRRAAELTLKALIAATGAPDRGTQARTDITGFNWSDVPVVLPEIGFMTNAEEDRLLNDPAYQDIIANALADAALRFLGESGP